MTAAGGVGRLAGWIGDFTASPPSPAATARAREVLLDALGCALAAHGDETARQALRVVGALGGNDDCTVIGTSLRTAIPQAAFANSVLVRSLDFNDIYAGPRQIGHPSDNIPVALAVAEALDRSGAEVVQAIRLGYEIYGRLQDNTDPTGVWDHVAASGIVAAAMTGWLLRLPADRLAHAMALAAMHCATLGEVRRSHVSAAKSIANAVEVQTATLLTLLAAEGMTGPALALEGARGFATLVLDGASIETLLIADGRPDRLLLAGLKPYPCFALGQGPVAAALTLRKRMAVSADAIARITLVLADSEPARMRLTDQGGAFPKSREAADHSVQYLVAVALLEGRVDLDQFVRRRWVDGDVLELLGRTEACIDPGLSPGAGAAFPCRLEIGLKDGTVHVAEQPVAPGHPDRPLIWQEIEDKFHRCAAPMLGEAARRRVVDLAGRVEEMPSIRPLLRSLVPAEA